MCPIPLPHAHTRKADKTFLDSNFKRKFIQYIKENNSPLETPLPLITVVSDDHIFTHFTATTRVKKQFHVSSILKTGIGRRCSRGRFTRVAHCLDEAARMAHVFSVGFRCKFLTKYTQLAGETHLHPKRTQRQFVMMA